MTPQHLIPYNPTPPKNEQTFHHFARLPLELRLYVWELALPCERFLKVRLERRNPIVSHPQETSTAAGKSTNAESRDSIILLGRKLVPKLLNICKESRQAALHFYRVQLPCEYESDTTNDGLATATGNGTFYFNPEFDMLKIELSRRRESFLDFVLDLRARDPKNVGLLRLALDENDLGHGALRNIPLDECDLTSRCNFVKVLSSLEMVYFLSIERAGRMYIGLIGGIPTMNDWEMRRSLPVEGAVPKFQRLASDPRNIEEDLKKVYLGTFEPRKMVIRWKKLLQKYDIKPQPGVQYRLMTALELRPTYEQIIDQDSALNYLLREDKEWEEEVTKWQLRLPKAKIERETPEFLQGVPKTAIGFWLFPIESLGEMPPDHLSLEESLQFVNAAKRVADMTNYRPELGVLDLH